MNDLILNSYVSNFCNSYDLTALRPDVQFEYFSNYCVVARDYQGTFDLDELSTGDAMGIDGIAIFVNDTIIVSPAEIESIAKQRLDARFVFTQAKTSSSVDLGDYLKFLGSVEHFFNQECNVDDSPLADWLSIKNKVYENAIKFDENPKLSLVFCYTGSYQGTEYIDQQTEAFLSRIRSTGLFRDVDVTFLDADRLKYIYRTLSNKITRQLTFDKHTILPKIPGVKRAFIGILPCSEYLQLICDDDRKLMRNVFYDNVRDFQGENSVNREIMETLKGEAGGGRFFVLLNNGVTIVAKSINPVGAEFTVRDFQVVNGCQTSHILYNNWDLLSGEEFITVKLIETDDVDLTNKITKATNRQTAVQLEAFAGLQQFHKELEAFYSSFPVEKRLYYERRSGQFDGEQSIVHNRIISIPNQIKSFVSVFLEEPHQIHFYYGKLLEDYSTGDNSVLFNEGHDTYPYYMASWLAFMLNNHLKKSEKHHLKKWRYHLALMVRVILGGQLSINRLNDTTYCKRYCERITNALSETNVFASTIEKAESILKNAIRTSKTAERKLPQDSHLTKQLLESSIHEFNSRGSKANIQDSPKFDGLYVGNIKSIVPDKGFGFLQYGNRQFYFNSRDMRLSVGQQVRFRLRNNGSNSEAFEITPLV